LFAIPVAQFAAGLDELRHVVGSTQLNARRVQLFVNAGLFQKGCLLEMVEGTFWRVDRDVREIGAAEKQLTKALPKMAKGSNDPALKEALTAHLKETQGQVARLEQIGELLHMKVTGKKCAGMEGLIKEGGEMLEEEGEEAVLDLGIIGAGSRVEHYEMSAYMTAISLANRCGCEEVAGLLQESLNEEQAAEKELRSIASGLIKGAPVEEEETGRSAAS
jgi:ferritin-like metal-binding protein YciE